MTPRERLEAEARKAADKMFQEHMASPYGSAALAAAKMLGCYDGYLAGAREMAQEILEILRGTTLLDDDGISGHCSMCSGEFAHESGCRIGDAILKIHAAIAREEGK